MQTPVAKIFPVIKGEWNASTSYRMLNIVIHDGRGYICKSSGSGVEPTFTGNTQWHLFADRGEAFTFEQMTQEQKDNLAQSANAAANEAKEYAQAVKYLLENLAGSPNPSEALTVQVAQNTAAIAEIDSKAENEVVSQLALDLSNEIGISLYSIYEIGSMTISSSGITYNDALTNTIRIKKGNGVWLSKGDRIKNHSDNVNIYIGWKDSAGRIGHISSWCTGQLEYECTKDGVYWILAKNADQSPISSIKEIASNIEIVSSRSNKSLLDAISKKVHYNNVDELRTCVAKEETIVYTLGYYSPADGGENTFIIKHDDGTLADNGGTIIKLNERDAYAVSVLDVQKINVLHFGARDNADIDSTDQFERYVTWCKQYREYLVTIPQMVLRLSRPQVFEQDPVTKYNVKIVGSNLVEQAADIRSGDKSFKQGTVLLFHPDSDESEHVFLDFRNKTEYAGPVLKNLCIYSTNSNNRDVAVKWIRGGQEGNISNVSIRYFRRGALWLNNVFDTYVLNLTIKNCGIWYDNTPHPALRLYVDRTEEGWTAEASTNTNAIHFTNFHFEHCYYFIECSKCADIHFVNGKIESMAGQSGKKEDNNAFIRFLDDTSHVFFTNVFFKTPSAEDLINTSSAPDYLSDNSSLRKAYNAPYYIEFAQTKRNPIIFDGCMFLSYHGGGLPFRFVTNIGTCVFNACGFRHIAGGRNAIMARQCTFTNNVVQICNEGALMTNNAPDTTAILDSQKGHPICFCGDCIVTGNKFFIGGSSGEGTVHTQFDYTPFDVIGENNIVRDNMYVFEYDKSFTFNPPAEYELQSCIEMKDLILNDKGTYAKEVNLGIEQGHSYYLEIIPNGWKNRKEFFADTKDSDNIRYYLAVKQPLDKSLIVHFDALSNSGIRIQVFGDPSSQDQNATFYLKLYELQ